MGEEHEGYRGRALIVEDEDLMMHMICDIAGGECLEARAVSTAAEARRLAAEEHFDLLITDINLGTDNGLELAGGFKKRNPRLAVIVVTAYPSKERIRVKEEIEVNDFLIKPFTATQLRYSIQAALEHVESHRNVEGARAEARGNDSMGLIGRSSCIQKTRERIELLAGGDFPVLIQGESGTGKEVIARAVHHASPRTAAKIVVVNCGAIPHHLEESAFFGHGRGAFTGAGGEKPGFIEAAHKSTLFLDEVGELSPAVQVKLLRVVDRGEFNRVGESFERQCDIRVVSATNRDLQSMVDAGSFRKDLFYRLTGATITTVPLARHPEDIPLLIAHFLAEAGCAKPITREAMALLCGYAWPGNVRQLKNAVKLLAVAAGARRRINALVVHAVMGNEVSDALDSPSFVEAKRDFEREYFDGMLKSRQGNISRVARDADMHRPSLLRKLKDLKISPADYRAVEN